MITSMSEPNSAPQDHDRQRQSRAAEALAHELGGWCSRRASTNGSCKLVLVTGVDAILVKLEGGAQEAERFARAVLPEIRAA
jgi:hypothetical protein